MDLPSPINTPDQILIRELQNNADEIERYRVLLTKCLDRISLLELHKNEILTNYMKNRNLSTNNYRENLSIKIEENQSVAQLLNACRSNSASFESIQQALTSIPSSNKSGQFNSPGSVNNKSESSSGTSMGQSDQYHINKGKLVIDEETLGYQNDHQIKKEILNLPSLNNGKHFCLSKNSKSDSALVSNYCTSNSSRTRTPCALQQNVANVVPRLGDPTNVLNLLSSAGMVPVKTNENTPFREELPVSAGESDQLKNVQQNIKQFFAAQRNNNSLHNSRRNSLDVGPRRKVPRLAEPQSLNLDSTPSQLPKLELPFNVQHSQNHMFNYRVRNHSNKQYRRIDPKNRTELQAKQEVEHWMQRDPVTNFHHCRFPGCNNNEKKGFSLKLRCKTHIEAEHLQIRYQCPYCSFQTARDDNLPKHIDKKHKDQLPEQQLQPQGYSGFSLLGYN